MATTLTQRRKARNPKRRHPGTLAADHVGPRWYRWRAQTAGADAMSAEVLHWHYLYSDSVVPGLTAPILPGQSWQSEPIGHPPLDWLKAEHKRVVAEEAKLAAYRDTVRRAMAKASWRL
jgi:hypothetical protein